MLIIVFEEVNTHCNAVDCEKGKLRKYLMDVWMEAVTV